MKDHIEYFKSLAGKKFDYESIVKSFKKEIEEAILIRQVENAFLDLFNSGEMNGTVHTCVGQELTGVAISKYLVEEDWITSNHRCHGHFIAKTKKWKELIDELRGYKSGICKGIGSSQHLFSKGFLSNGPQAALIPVGSGISKSLKLKNNNNVCVSFFGEGTLGEGLIYESMNLSSLKKLPHIFVLENNLYSQSTPQHLAVTGDFKERSEAFGIKFFQTNTWDLENLFSVCEQAVNFTRENNEPCFIDIKTYRLNAHSKSDDDRNPEEIKFFQDHDPLNIIESKKYLEKEEELIKKEIEHHIKSTEANYLDSSEYFHDQLPRKRSSESKEIINEGKRLINSLNEAYDSEISAGAFFIGEDILDPYGGAFKISKGLSTKYPENVIGMPISEAAITGFGIGMSMMGNKTFVEIMFGDFLSYSFDQILSNASKFYHMYAFQCSAPVRIRTPMGGKRGYGPTHSQSIEKHFTGMDNVAVFSVSSLLDPKEMFENLRNLDCPILILENKVDYGKKLFQENEFLSIEQIGGAFGPVILKPKGMEPNLTIVSYGGTAREIADGFVDIFQETSFVPQIICLVALNPIDINQVSRLSKKTSNLVTVEDGSTSFGIGSEIISSVMEDNKNIDLLRIGAKPYPVPSIRSMEDESLPTLSYIINSLNKFKKL